MDLHSRSLATILLFLAACSGPAGPVDAPVELLANRSLYQIGGTGELTLTNHHHRSVSVATGLCTAEIQIREGDAWNSVGFLGQTSDPPTICTSRNTPVEPGSSYSRLFPVDDRFSSGGIFRFRVAIRHDGSASFVISPEFAVEAP